MQLHHLRHATHILQYGNSSFLVDPVLCPAGAQPPIDNSPRPRPNPLVPLPLSSASPPPVQAVLVTHTHRDHFDLLPTDALAMLPLLCPPEETTKLQALGFPQLVPIERDLLWSGIRLHRTGGRHGSGDIALRLGPISGYVLSSPDEPSLYLAGDTIWCPEVEATLQNWQPEICILFGGEARFRHGGPITMGVGDICRVAEFPGVKAVVVLHMEAYDHCGLSRHSLHQALRERGLADRVFVPSDGQSLTF